MKRILSAILTLCLSVFAINAQELENSTLWKIEGQNLKQASYLFGTIHMTCDASLNNDVLKALDETTQIVLEIDMDDPSLQAKMMGGMYMKDGKRISDFVSAEDYKLIDSMITKEVGMPLKMLENMKPFFLISMLYPKFLDCPMQSFEQELMKIAAEQNEEILGLETIEEQMQVFEDIPYEDQVADLLRTAKDNLAYDKATMKKMMEMYTSEDINAMVDLMNDDSYSAVAQHQDKLLNNRNKNWIPKIENFIKDQPTFFGVGAGHLAGEFGVINLLRKAGYKVTAVMD